MFSARGESVAIHSRISLHTTCDFRTNVACVFLPQRNITGFTEKEFICLLVRDAGIDTEISLIAWAGLACDVGFLPSARCG
jgi:hypothetical protein